MDYIHFFLNNRRLISFGFLLTFFSSFGQTFLISLYVPDIIREFQLSNSSFGMLFGAATILSSISLTYTGKFIDTFNLRNYTFAAVLLLILSCVMISLSFNLIILFAGFWGLRLAGQGLLSHISNTSISKFFNETRGKALSISVLGYSIGEGLFPVAIGTMIGLIGWRYSMILNAAIIGIILLPFIVLALSKKELHYTSDNTSEKKDTLKFTRLFLLKDKSFYIIAFNSFVLPFIITGLFFHQIMLANEKGWSIELLSMSFIGYALGRAVFSLISGKLIDNYSATFLFPFYLLPFAVGLLVLTVFDGPFIAPIYLTLTGVSVGLGSTIKTAVLAEVYGTGNLGSIRAVFATLMVLSTALSPVLFGFLLDSGFTFTFIAIISMCIVSMAMILSYLLHPDLKMQFEME
jgi:MFS family permease